MDVLDPSTTPTKIETSYGETIYELAGRNDLWRKGKMVTADGTAGGGWADIWNAENWMCGSNFDGTGTEGPCFINCTNEN